MSANTDLTNQTIATTFTQLLHIADTDGVEATEHYICDGNGTASCLSLGTAAVGVGTADPQAQLHIAHASDSSLALTRTAADGVSDAQDVGTIFFGVDGDDTNPRWGAKIVGTTAEVWSNGGTDNGMDLEFYTCDAGDATLDLRMTITDGGLVGIGVASPAVQLDLSSIGSNDCDFRMSCGSGGHQYTLQSDQNTSYFKIIDSSATADRFTIKNDGDFIGSAAANISDERLKTNITSLSGSLDKINQLRGVSFTWKPEARKSTGKVYLGLIAQEVEQHFPDAVMDESINDTDSITYKSVYYTGLIAPMIKAIQELSAKVATLESQ